MRNKFGEARGEGGSFKKTQEVDVVSPAGRKTKKNMVRRSNGKKGGKNERSLKNSERGLFAKKTSNRGGGGRDVYLGGRVRFGLSGGGINPNYEP